MSDSFSFRILFSPKTLGCPPFSWRSVAEFLQILIPGVFRCSKSFNVPGFISLFPPLPVRASTLFPVSSLWILTVSVIKISISVFVNNLHDLFLSSAASFSIFPGIISRGPQDFRRWRYTDLSLVSSHSYSGPLIAYPCIQHTDLPFVSMFLFS